MARGKQWVQVNRLVQVSDLTQDTGFRESVGQMFPEDGLILENLDGRKGWDRH